MKRFMSLLFLFASLLPSQAMASGFGGGTTWGLNPTVITTVSTSRTAPHEQQFMGSLAITSHSSGDGISIVSLLDPENPVLLAWIADINNTRKTEGVCIDWPYIYGTSQGTSPTDNRGIYVLDGNKLLLGGLNATWASTTVGTLVDTANFNLAGTCYISTIPGWGKVMFVPSDGTNSLRLNAIDINDPTTPVLISDLVVDTAAHGADQTVGLSCDNKYCFMTSAGTNSFYSILVSDPTLMVKKSTQTGTSTELTGAFFIERDGDMIYGASKGGNAVWAYSIANQEAPVEAGYLIDATNLNGAHQCTKIDRTTMACAIKSTTGGGSIAFIDITGCDTGTCTGMKILNEMGGSTYNSSFGTLVGVRKHGKYLIGLNEGGAKLAIVSLGGIDLSGINAGVGFFHRVDVDSHASFSGPVDFGGSVRGLAIPLIQSGNCTLNGGTPATCTFAVTYGSATSYHCSVSTETNTNAVKLVRTTKILTTLTSAVNGDTGVVHIICDGK